MGALEPGADLDGRTCSPGGTAEATEAALLARMQELREVDLAADDAAREEWVALLTALDARGKRTTVRMAEADAASLPGGQGVS